MKCWYGKRPQRENRRRHDGLQKLWSKQTAIWKKPLSTSVRRNSAKKAGRLATEGIVDAYIHGGGR